eukprot:Rhum_TRINITY_DN14249_c2_g1::Rhum_TRINITY_DN14249_c2_g1_i1::g.76873::m.76873/K12176/COPS2, CSN2, TRIP15; COP9 signalosome complex subunit 2
MSDEEYIYEEDEEYQCSDDGEDDAEDTLEGLYYDAKDRMDDHPEGAVEGFCTLLECGDAANAKWCWKAMKRLVRLYHQLARYDEMLETYSRLLRFTWDGRTRGDTEKAINKLLDLTAGAGPVSAMYDVTSQYVSEGTRNEKLWFSVRMKAAQALLDCGDLARCAEALDELKESCRAVEGGGGGGGG